MPKPMTLDKKTPFGKAVCNRLTAMGKNQKFLAQETGLTQVYVYKLLNGKHNPSVKTLYSISKVTGIGIEELTKALLDKG